MVDKPPKSWKSSQLHRYLAHRSLTNGDSQDNPSAVLQSVIVNRYDSPHGNYRDQIFVFCVTVYALYLSLFPENRFVALPLRRSSLDDPIRVLSGHKQIWKSWFFPYSFTDFHLSGHVFVGLYGIAKLKDVKLLLLHTWIMLVPDRLSNEPLANECRVWEYPWCNIPIIITSSSQFINSPEQRLTPQSD